MPATTSTFPRHAAILAVTLGAAMTLAALAIPAKAESAATPASAAGDATRRAVDQNVDIAVRRQLERQAAERQSLKRQAEAEKVVNDQRASSANGRQHGDAIQ